MSAIIAIARLTIRDAVRSRLVLSLLALLLVTIVGLPIMVKGDGTLYGQVRVLLNYTLGAASMILGAASLWASCGAVSREVQGRQIRLVAVKPVRRYQIWVGKWVGILALNAVLLGVTGLATYLLLQRTVRLARFEATERSRVRAQILVGRQRFLPREEPIEEEAVARYRWLKKEGRVAPDLSRDAALQLIRRQIQTERWAVAPGFSRTWLIDTGRGRPAAGRPPLVVRYRFGSTTLDRRPVSGTWTVGPEDRPAAFRHEVVRLLDGTHEFSVPAGIVAPDQPVVITFANAVQDESNPLMFKPGTGLELLAHVSSFEANLARSLLILFSQLAVLSALGLTAGTLFSFPVATFSAASLLSICLLAHYFAVASSPDFAAAHHHHEGPAPEPSALQVAGEHLIGWLNYVTEPAMRHSPLSALSDGILVSWWFTGRAMLLLLVVYPGAMGILSSAALSRRELALPTQ